MSKDDKIEIKKSELEELVKEKVKEELQVSQDNNSTNDSERISRRSFLRKAGLGSLSLGALLSPVSADYFIKDDSFSVQTSNDGGSTLSEGLFVDQNQNVNIPNGVLNEQGSRVATRNWTNNNFNDYTDTDAQNAVTGNINVENLVTSGNSDTVPVSQGDGTLQMQEAGGGIKAESEPSNPEEGEAWVESKHKLWEYSEESDYDNILDVTTSSDSDYVYIGVEDSQRVRKLDASDNSILWSVKIDTEYDGDPYSVEIGPNDDYLYCGFYQQYSGTVRKIDASDGSKVWDTTVFNNNSEVTEIEADPNGNFIVAGGPAHFRYQALVRKIDASDGSEIWNYDGHNPSDGDGVESISLGPNGNYVYAALKGGNSGLKKLDASDASEVWSQNYLGPVVAGPNGNYVYVFAGGALRKLDASDGSEIWSHSLSDSVRGVGLSDNGNAIYVSSGSYGDYGRVTKLQASDGSELWKNFESGHHTSAVTVSSTNNVYYVKEDNLKKFKGQKNYFLNSWNGSVWDGIHTKSRREYSFLANHETNSATSGGGSTWSVQPYNNVEHNRIPGASYDETNYKLTLPAGEYYADCRQSGYDTNELSIRLYNQTGGQELIRGSTVYSSGNGAADSNAEGFFTLSQESVIVLEMISANTTSYSFGVSRANNGVPSPVKAGKFYIEKI